MSRARRPVPRLRTVLLATVLAVTSFGVEAAPVPAPAPGGRASAPLPFGLGPPVARAAFCATPNPTFTGKLTQELLNTPPGAPATISRITNPNVYGWISNVDGDWACTLYRRYDGLAWNTTASLGTFDWGTIINSTSVSCNWAVGSTDYLKANNSATCPATDSANALTITLDQERVYQNDSAHDTVGDFSFAHSDCDTSPYYGAEKVKPGVTFSGTDVDNRPGQNCDVMTLDGMSITQSITYDGTAPTLAFTFPSAGGPTLVPSAFAGVTFDAQDNLAGFGGTSDWDLQRQVATWNGTACGTFAADTGANALVSGTTSAPGQVSGQGLALNACYRWVLSATDLNGNSSTLTSGVIRTDTGGVLGSQAQFRFESWDLGGGDTLSVSVGVGNVLLAHPIVSLPIRGGALELALAYNSHDGTNIGLGPGWRLNTFRRLTIDPATGFVTYAAPDGSRHTFTSPVTVGTVTTYTRPVTLYATLVKDTAQTANEFTLTYRDQAKDRFDLYSTTEAVLVKEEDRFGNAVTFAYFAGTDNLKSATDPAGRVVDFAWDTAPTPDRLTSVTDWAYVSGGVVATTNTGARRQTRFFYDGSGNLAGFADPINTNAGETCPLGATGDLHLTCFAYSGGLVSSISKQQTVETLSAGVLGTALRTITTQVSYTNADVATVKDAEEVNGGTAGTVFSHPAAGGTKVVRQGSPPSETTYALLSATDARGRVGSVFRKLGATSIEQRLTYANTEFPIEPTEVKDNATAALSTPARAVTYTYLGGSLGLVAKIVEPLTGSTNRWTEFTYNANNDVTERRVSLDGSPTSRTISRSCYSATTCATSDADPKLFRTIEDYVDGTKGGAAGNVEDVTTEYLYDAFGQRIRETRQNYAAGGTLLDARAIGSTYDANGNLTASITNYVDGLVSSPGDDVTPNPTTNARTDLTTAFTYDTAGNRVSGADPRRAIAAATAGATYARDTFSRTVTDAWGSADAGGAWSGTTADFDVNGSVGTIVLPSATNRNAYLTAVAAPDQELLIKLNLNQLAVGGSTFTWFYLRRQDASNFYQLRLTFETDQQLRLTFFKTVAGTQTSISNATVTGETHTTGGWYWIRARLSGTSAVNLKARLWRDGTTEPPTWPLDATDTAPPAVLQGTGHFGIRLQATGTGTYPVTGSYDELSLTAIGGGTGALGADDYVGRSAYDALNEATKETTPTTPGVVVAQKTATAAYDELGALREAKDMGDVVRGTEYDRAARATKTFEDQDGAGPTAAAQTSATTYDAAGRTLTAKDRRQVADATLGSTLSAYDELGRVTDVTEASGSTPDLATTTHSTYDALDRRLSEIVGYLAATAQTTTYTYDLGGRALTTDDEFTCAGTTYDYRDLALTVVEGLPSPACSGTSLRTVTNTYDGLGRQTKSEVTAGQGIGDRTIDDTLDAAGRRLTTSATKTGVASSTTYTLNALDEAASEVRSDGSTAKTNHDPAGNVTDRCYWKPAITVGACYPVGTTPWTNPPTSATTTTSDARNNRIGLTDAATSATTTYDPAHNYQVGAVYLPTVAGTGREHQTIFGYDDRDRLASVTHQLCVISAGHLCSSTTPTGSDSYLYDEADSRTRVNENTGAAALDRYYCYDALDRVISTRSASGCGTGLLEAYTYDDSGNRTSAAGVTFTYNGSGQLTACSAGCGTIAYDAAGRTSKWNGWAFEYDAEGRMTRACQSTTDCTGLLNEVEFTYDGDGHRTRITKYDTGIAAAAATWDLRYQGDAIVEEKLTDAAHPAPGTVVRSYVVDDAGSVVKLTIPAGEIGAGTYLVTWNGHGDALGLWLINADGTLTLANSYTYSTWGSPTTTVAAGFPDLAFRYLYVGASDVQWDDFTFGLGLYYMHARHYSPSLGRFLQPDPSAAEANLYGYAGDSPVTATDPGGLRPPPCFTCIAHGLQLEERYAHLLRLMGWEVRVHPHEQAWAGRRGVRVIDIIARKGNVLVRIEIKYNTSPYRTSQYVKDIVQTGKTTAKEIGTRVYTRITRFVPGRGASVRMFEVYGYEAFGREWGVGKEGGGSTEKVE